MSETPTQTAATILAAEPQLFANDLGVATRFYVEKLGFAVVFSHGELAFYAQVSRGGARLNLRVTDGPTGARNDEVDALSATLIVDNIRSLFEEYERAGAIFHQPLQTEPWGARTFIVVDPDGNLLCFAGD